MTSPRRPPLTHEQARRYLHLRPQEWSADEVAAGARLALDQHLADCAECRAYAAGLAALQPEVSRTLHARWDSQRPRLGRHRSIPFNLRRHSMHMRTFNRVGSVVGLGALVLMVVLVGWVLSNPNQPAADSTPTLPAPTGEATLMPTAVVPPENEPTHLIAFESDRDGNSEIYVMRADGSQLTNLTQDPAADLAPVWSPDGQRLAFFSNRSGHFQVYVINAVDIVNGAAASLTQLTQALEGMDYDLAVPLVWAPDGTGLAAIAARSMAEQQPGQGQIDLIQADGSGSTLVVGFGGVPPGQLELEWSPDGQRLAFATLAEKEPAIYSLTPDGMEVVEVTAGENAEARYQQYLGLAWSPDGQRLAYLSHGPDTPAADAAHTRLTIYDRNTGEKSTDLAPALAEIAGSEIRGLTWSPDGSTLAFLANSDQNGCWLIHLLTLPTAELTTLRPVCHANRVDEPQWSSDGQWLVFTADRDGTEGGGTVIARLNVAEAQRDLANVAPQFLTSGPSRDLHPRWQP